MSKCIFENFTPKSQSTKKAEKNHNLIIFLKKSRWINPSIWTWNRKGFMTLNSKEIKKNVVFDTIEEHSFSVLLKYMSKPLSGEDANKTPLPVMLLPGIIRPLEILKISLRQGRCKIKSFIFWLICSGNRRTHAGVPSCWIYQRLSWCPKSF